MHACLVKFNNTNLIKSSTENILSLCQEGVACQKVKQTSLITSIRVLSRILFFKQLEYDIFNRQKLIIL